LGISTEETEALQQVAFDQLMSEGRVTPESGRRQRCQAAG
jgi:hypothetical protein